MSSIKTWLRWLASFLEDTKGRTSVKKLAIVVVTLSTSWGSYELLHAVAERYTSFGGDISAIVGLVLGFLSTLAGVSYVGGKWLDNKRDIEEQPKD